jgi:hypothetical protein
MVAPAAVKAAMGKRWALNPLPIGRNTKKNYFETIRF